MHRRPDGGKAETRGRERILRGVEIASLRHGLHGVADVVELKGQPPRPFPVEYKRGRPKAHRADDVQLCAQALCLEEMFLCTIPEGALFYGQSRRRKRVIFDRELRELTLRAAEAVRSLITEGQLPQPVYDRRRCGNCSLISLCMPKATKSVSRWLARSVASEAVPE